MMPKMMLRPMVVMKMKKETWNITSRPNLRNELSAGCDTMFCVHVTDQWRSNGLCRL